MPGLAGRSPSHDTESDRQEVASMLQAMAHRGTSHTIWQPRPIDPCLGSCHHEPTPPLISHDSGYSLFMDGTVFDSDSEPVDAPFLLCEFRKNGTVALNRLSGDFAIAVWDAPRHELTLIRDPFGARPLYFTSSSAGFCFASEIKGLLALPHIRPILNRGRIGDFFFSELEGFDRESTFYQGIYRVPAGGSVALTHGRIQSSRYWTLSPPSPHASGTEDYVDGFSHHFEKAVARHYREPRHTGILLSGGLDSSAIAAMAVSMGIPSPKTFSLIAGDDDPHCMESRAIKGIQSHLPLHSQSDDSQEVTPLLPPLSELAARTDNPFSLTLIAGPIPLFARARTHGITHLLDGLDGDVVTSLVGNYPWFLANDHGLWAALKAIVYKSKYFGETLNLPLESAGFVVRWALNRSFASDRGFRRLIRRVRSHRSRLARARESLLKKAFIQEIDLPDRLQQRWENEHPVRPQTLYDITRQSIESPHLPAAIERYEEAASIFSIQIGHPFMDRQLIDYCLHLPWDHRIRSGQPKWVLRESMRTHLPASIIDQSKLPNIGGWFLSRIFDRYLETHPSPPSWLAEHLEDFVDIDALVEDWNHGRRSKGGEMTELLEISILLGEWLRQHF